MVMSVAGKIEMTEQSVNRTVVYRYYEEIMNNGKTDSAEEILDSSILIKGAGLHVQGIDAFKQYVANLRESMQEMRCTIKRSIQEEDKVAVWWSQTGIDNGLLQNKKPTRKEMLNQGISIFLLASGKIYRILYQQDTYGLLRQIDGIPNVAPALEAERTESASLINDDNMRSGKSSTPAENKDIVRRYTDAIMNGKDMDAGAKLIASDCTSKMLSYFMIKSLRGPDEFLPLIKSLRKGLPDLEVTIDEQMAENDTVVAKWTALGTNTGSLPMSPASGIPAVLEGITWFRIVDGEFVEIAFCEDYVALLRQVGALQMPKQKDTSHEYNKAIMYKFFDGIWNKADYSLIEKYVSPDMIQHIPGEGNGVDGFMETVRKYHAGFTDMSLDIQDEVAEGDRVLHRWCWTCTHTGPFNGMPATGKRVTFTGMTLVRIKDGKMVEHWSNVDVVSLLMQLGVIPAPRQ